MDGSVVQYLKDFVAGTEQLPTELKSSFGTLRELDQRTAQLEAEAAASLEAHLVEAAAQQQQRRRQAPAGAKGEARPRDDRFDQDWQQISQLCEEKVKVAHRIYDFVDARIQELDAQLSGFDAELAAERARLGVEKDVRFAEAFAAAGGEALIGGRGRGRGRGRGLGRPASGAAGLPKVQKTEAPVLLPSPVVSTALAPVTTEGTQATLMPVDPNEPTYCYCNQVSFGEMIACENEECAIEWFHLQCVGIDPANKPEGDWYCKECSEKLKKEGKLQGA